MNFAHALKQAGAFIGKRVAGGDHDKAADADLPLGARIGALLTVQMSPFIAAAACGSLVPMPRNPNAQIIAVSRVKFNLAGKLYRYYLETGDTGTAPEVFLQVYVNEQGEVAELFYCSRLTRIIPANDDEQFLFTGEHGKGLGDAHYKLWKEQLLALGVDAGTLQTVFGDTPQLVFHRDAGNPGDAFIKPFVGTEVRIDDRNGEQGLAQKIHYMPYVRTCQHGQEYLLITTEIVDSQNGDPCKRAFHVDFVVALALATERIVIQ